MRKLQPKLQFQSIPAARAFYAQRRANPSRSFAACIRATGHMQDIQIIGITGHQPDQECRFMGLI